MTWQGCRGGVCASEASVCLELISTADIGPHFTVMITIPLGSVVNDVYALRSCLGGHRMVYGSVSPGGIDRPRLFFSTDKIALVASKLVYKSRGPRDHQAHVLTHTHSTKAAIAAWPSDFRSPHAPPYPPLPYPVLYRIGPQTPAEHQARQ